jgi:hypothetical protein
MKRIISLISLVAIAFVMTIGCRRYEYCQCDKKLPASTSSGIIIENAKLNINDPKTGEYFTELVINEESLQGENSYKVSFDDGATFDNIDFSKYTILGYPILGGGRTSYNKNVTKDVTNKKYIYTIDALECTYYRVASIATNCVLIPKIEDDYTVEFVVNYARWKNGKTTQISKEEW